jgi:hypothetical protein
MPTSRCDLCTPLVQPLLTEVAVGCKLEGFATGSALATASLSAALPFLSSPDALKRALPQFPFEAVTQSAGLSIRDSLTLWAPWPAFSVYDPSMLIQAELSIWDYAVSNQQASQTMVCAETFQPIPDAVTCNPLIDTRRQVSAANPKPT